MPDNTGLNPFDDIQLVEIDNYIFGVKVINCWLDGKCIDRKDFTAEIFKHLEKHHAETIKQRLENIR
jgi:hypothetical protein